MRPPRAEALVVTFGGAHACSEGPAAPAPGCRAVGTLTLPLHTRPMARCGAPLYRKGPRVSYGGAAGPPRLGPDSEGLLEGATMASFSPRPCPTTFGPSLASSAAAGTSASYLWAVGYRPVPRGRPVPLSRSLRWPRCGLLRRGWLNGKPLADGLFRAGVTHSGALALARQQHGRLAAGRPYLHRAKAGRPGCLRGSHLDVSHSGHLRDLCTRGWLGTARHARRQRLHMRRLRGPVRRCGPQPVSRG